MSVRQRVAATEAHDDPVIAVEGLEVDFRTEDGLLHAVRGLDFTLGRGEVLGIVGESGSGKSVTALSIMGLLPRTATIRGSARLNGEEMLNQPRKVLNRHRGKTISMVFQDPMTSLNPVHRVGDQIVEAIRAHSDISKADARDKAVHNLERVGIPNPRQRVRSYPHELSGGMRQRAMIAMAMANEPEVVIADEPTTALDVTIQAQVMEVLAEAREATGSAMILITHDLGLVAGVADRIIVMYAGQAFEVGDTRTVFYESRNPYTRGLLGSIPRWTDRDGVRLEPIPGAPPSIHAIPDGCAFASRCVYATDLCRETPPELARAEHGQLSRCHYRDSLPPLDLKARAAE